MVVDASSFVVGARFAQNASSFMDGRFSVAASRAERRPISTSLEGAGGPAAAAAALSSLSPPRGAVYIQ